MATVDAASAPVQTAGHAVVYHIAWRWRIFVIVLTVGIFGFWCYLLNSTFWTDTKPGMAALELGLTFFLADVFGWVLYQFLVVVRLAVTPQGLLYKGPGTSIWSPWSNVAGVDRRLLGSFYFTGLRLKRPALKASWIYGFERTQDPLFQATFMSGMTYTPDGAPGGGLVPANPGESDESLPGMPNDFIGLSAFQPDWQSDTIGNEVFRYAPWALGSKEASQAQPGGPPVDSRLRRYVVWAICALIVLVEVAVTTRAEAIQVAGNPFAWKDNPLISCVYPCADASTITGITIGAGRVTAATNAASLVVARAANGRVLARHKLPGTFKTGAASPDGRYLAGGNDRGNVRVMDLRTHRSWTRHLPVGSIPALAVSANDAVLAVAGGDSTVHFLRLRDGQPIGTATVRDSSNIATLQLSPDGLWAILTQDDGTCQAFHVGAHPKSTLYLDGYGANYAGFAPDESYFTIGTYDGVVHVESMTDNTQQIVNTDDVTSIAMSANHRLVAAGTSSGNVHVWRVSDGADLGSYHVAATNITALAFSPNNRQIAAGTDLDAVYVVNR